MRALGRRKKKLIIAFHFQFANQAAWKCGDCRLQGLERQRACPFLPNGSPHRPRIVWARREVTTTRCPKGSITAASLKWLEEFAVWKSGGGQRLMALPAKTAEAFFVLENELRAEQNHARQNHQDGTR